MPQPVRFRAALPLAALLTFPCALAAQSVAAGDSALARGDTSAAIRAYEAAIKRRLDDVVAHYHAGVLYLSRVKQDNSVDDNRLRAEEHLKYAVRFAGDSEVYLMALASVYRRAPEPMLRMQVPKLVIRAAGIALKRPGPESAMTLYEAGRMTLSNQRFAPARRRTDNDLLPEEDVYVDAQSIERYLDRQAVIDLETIGGTDRHQAESYFTASYAADPHMVRAGRMAVQMMVDQRRFPEGVALAKRIAGAMADSGNAWAALGMAQARASLWREAQASFETALSKMSPEERAPYDDLGTVLSPADSAAYENLSAPAQRLLGFQYWGTQQPLFLTDLNEARTEYFTRVTHETIAHADRELAMPLHRFFNPDIALRYGPVAAFRLYPRSRLYRLWVDLGGRIPDVYVDLFREARIVLPADFSNIPVLYDMDTVDVQTAQFRGTARDSTDLAVFTFAPAGRMAHTAPRVQQQLINAVFIKDALFRDIGRAQDTTILVGGDSLLVERRRARFTLSPAQRLLRVESYLPLIGRAARNQTALEVRSFAGDTLMMSDVLMAGNMVPKDSAPQRWSDFILEPSTGRLDPKQTVGLLWEIYNLVPDSTGVVRYHVELRVTVKDVERHGILSIIPGTVGDWLGLSAKGDDAVALGYNRAATGTRGGRRVEYLTLNLDNAPNAEYEVEVQVTDQIQKKAVSELRRLVITPTSLTR